ncbi:hypothetical protein [Nonomuraea rubra]
MPVRPKRLSAHSGGSAPAQARFMASSSSWKRSPASSYSSSSLAATCSSV